MKILDVTKQMVDRSVDIIRITKSFPASAIKIKIARYMSETCNCRLEVYTDDVLCRVVKNVVYDYLHNASRENAIAFAVKFIEDDFPGWNDEFTRLCLALRSVPVCTKVGLEWYYIDGFHETDYTRKLDEEISNGEI